MAELAAVLRRRPTRQNLIDLGVAAALAASVIMSIRIAWEPRAAPRPHAFAFTLGITIGVLSLFGRRAPRLVLFASAAALQIYYLSGYPGIWPALPLSAALVTAIATGHRRAALAVALWYGVVPVLWLTQAEDRAVVAVLRDSLPDVALLATVWLLGETIRGGQELDRQRRALEKIKTIGDAYMVAGGLPERCEGHVEALADMALAMLSVVSGRQGPDGSPLEIRVGLDAGPVVAGVIGTDKFAWDIWGDTVNTASRMESTGVPGRIQTTDRVHARLRDRYRFQERGRINVKGKGELCTYLLVGPIGDDSL